MAHDIIWRTAAPLWSPSLSDDTPKTRLEAPALLRFSEDSFMDDLGALMRDAPAALPDFVARPETWRAPDVGWVADGSASLDLPLKLFQPAQSRYYLVAASLVCRRTGLPDRKVDIARGDAVSMVLRRLVPATDATLDPTDADTFVEFAWIGDRRAGAWTAVTAAQTVLRGEEHLPLFPLSFRQDGVQRALRLGAIPVAGREVYETSGPAGAEPEPLVSVVDDPLIELADPRKAVWADRPGRALALFAETKNSDAVGAGTKMTNEDARELLRYTLLDIADFLGAELPAIWATILAENPGGLNDADQDLYVALGRPVTVAISFREALRRTEGARQSLLDGSSWPAGLPEAVPASMTREQVALAADGLISGAGIDALVFASLDAAPATNTVGNASPLGRAPSAAADAAARTSVDGAFYVVRCVYERPRCAPFVQPLVSAASRPFRLAGFYDADAPVRPVTIRMPENPGISGLGKFAKGVNFVMSDKLRRKVDHLMKASLVDIDEGNIEDAPSEWGIGMICSLSIPIITICAMIVLMIFIQLLNIVFWWLPFLRICLPIPVKK